MSPALNCGTGWLVHELMIVTPDAAELAATGAPVPNLWK